MIWLCQICNKGLSVAVPSISVEINTCSGSLKHSCICSPILFWDNKLISLDFKSQIIHIVIHIYSQKEQKKTCLNAEDPCLILTFPAATAPRWVILTLLYFHLQSFSPMLEPVSGFATAWDLPPSPSKPPPPFQINFVAALICASCID